MFKFDSILANLEQISKDQEYKLPKELAKDHENQKVEEEKKKLIGIKINKNLTRLSLKSEHSNSNDTNNNNLTRIKSYIKNKLENEIEKKSLQTPKTPTQKSGKPFWYDQSCKPVVKRNSKLIDFLKDKIGQITTWNNGEKIENDITNQQNLGRYTAADLS